MNNTDKLLEDMEALCQTTAKEREEMYIETLKLDETLRDAVDELQDMINFIESMDLIEGCGIDDILNQLNASISAYNEGI